MPLFEFVVVQVFPSGAAGSHGCWDWHGVGMGVPRWDLSCLHLRKASIFSPFSPAADKSGVTCRCPYTTLGCLILAREGTFPGYGGQAELNETNHCPSHLPACPFLSTFAVREKMIIVLVTDHRIPDWFG